MKIHSFLAIFLMLFLCQCKPQVEKPEPFLNSKQMVELLTEIQLTEAQIETSRSGRSHLLDSVQLQTDIAYAKIFEPYGLDQASFEENLYYYAYHSWDLEEIYRQVDENLRMTDSLK